MKIRVYKSYLVFVLGVILVGPLTFMEVPCPIDNGTGVIAGASGLEVGGVEGELIDLKTLELGCAEVYDEYTYAVKISLVNETTTPIYGAILLKFLVPAEALAVKRITRLELDGVVDLPSEAELLARFPGPPPMAMLIFVEIPAETTKVVEEIIVFQGFRLYSKHHRIVVEIAGEIVCPYSGGTGKVPITEWLRIKASVQ